MEEKRFSTAVPSAGEACTRVANGSTKTSTVGKKKRFVFERFPWRFVDSGHLAAGFHKLGTHWLGGVSAHF